MTPPLSSSSASSLDVLTVGEPMALFSAAAPGPLSQAAAFHRVPAGAELNVAVGLSRLGFKVGYVSRVGADSLGEHLRTFMQGEGIDCRHVTVDPAHPTGFMMKSLEADGSDPQIEYFRRGSAASHLSPADCPAGGFAASRHLHLTGISPALSQSARELVFEMATQARAAGRSVSFDPNLRPRLWASQQEMIDTMNQLAALADTVLPGLAEGRLLTGRQEAADIAAFYLERGARQVVIKLGPSGAYCADASGGCTVAGMKVARVVDTVGAGDGFAVGVISALLEGLPLSEATGRGNAIGARVVQFPGDSDGLPNRDQLDAGLRSGEWSLPGPL